MALTSRIRCSSAQLAAGAALIVIAVAAPAQTLVQRQTVGTPVVPSATALLDWAQAAYPQYFPGRKPDLAAAGYTYRHYPETGNYAGTAGSDVVIWGPVSGHAPAPVKVGTLGDFACAVTPAPCGLKSTHRVTVDGLVREFIVYQPFAVQGATPAPAPVVMMLHGSTGTGEEFYNRSGWREKADSIGLIAVFPTALVHCHYDDENGNRVFEPAERKAVTKWAGGSLGHPTRLPLCSAADIAQMPAARRAEADHPLADDVAFLRRVVEVLTAEYPADRKRVYVTGFSNGAEMSARLAAEASSTFAAVASTAGGLVVPPVPLTRALSIVQTIGERDPGFVVGMGYASALPLDGSLLGNAMFQQGIVQPFTTLLQLDPARVTVSAPVVTGVATSQFGWTASQAGLASSLRVVVVAGAEHEYPNGRNHPLVMADLLWEFFKDQQLP